jgi:hypothetical protein
VIDGVAQVVGLGGIADGNSGITGLRNAGGWARQLMADFGGRVQAGGCPELLVEAFVLVLQPHKLHDLDQGQAPGDDRETNQQPDDCAFNGFEGGCQQAHDDVFLCSADSVKCVSEA